MRRNTLRFSVLVGVVLLLALILVSGCTRSKSSSPPTATKDESSSQSATEPPPSDATPDPGEDPISVTTTAWANETATAEAQAQQPTKAPATTVPEPTKSVEPTSPPETKAPEPTPEPTDSAEAGQPAEGGVHVVQSGENLFRIALDYGLSYEALATHNGIVNPNLIYVGQELKIPSAGAPVTPPSQDTGASYHIVQLDENLFRVALEHNMLFTELAAANGLSYPYTIYVGQKLIIP